MSISLIQQGIRSASALSTVSTVSITDIIETLSAVDVRLVIDGDDVERLHVVQPDGNYVSIKVGDKAHASGQGLDRIKSLINSNLIYCGQTNNGAWFTFGPRPSGNTRTVTVSVADLLGSGVKAVVA